MPELPPLKPGLCPRCRVKGKRLHELKKGDTDEPGAIVEFVCPKCGQFFDNRPDEGGTHDDRDASRRLVREEENRERRAVQRTQTTGRAERDRQIAQQMQRRKR